jgi:hypothetical protein
MELIACSAAQKLHNGSFSYDLFCKIGDTSHKVGRITRLPDVGSWFAPESKDISMQYHNFAGIEPNAQFYFRYGRECTLVVEIDSKKIMFKDIYGNKDLTISALEGEIEELE